MACTARRASRRCARPHAVTSRGARSEDPRGDPRSRRTLFTARARARRRRTLKERDTRFRTPRPSPICRPCRRRRAREAPLRCRRGPRFSRGPSPTGVRAARGPPAAWAFREPPAARTWRWRTGTSRLRFHTLARARLRTTGTRWTARAWRWSRTARKSLGSRFSARGGSPSSPRLGATRTRLSTGFSASSGAVCAARCISRRRRRPAASWRSR